MTTPRYERRVIHGHEIGVCVMKLDGRDVPFVVQFCPKCEYTFATIAASEHEPTLCPNCGVRFATVSITEEEFKRLKDGAK